MNDFLKTLTHGRKLQGAVRELPLSELELVAQKLNNIIENRKAKEAELLKAEKEKQAKIADIKKQLEDAGLDLDDLKNSNTDKKSKRAGQKRSIKYMLIDEDGTEHPWSGVGRTPKAYVKALSKGGSLDKFKIS